MFGIRKYSVQFYRDRKYSVQFYRDRKYSVNIYRDNEQQTKTTKNELEMSRIRNELWVPFKVDGIVLWLTRQL